MAFISPEMACQWCIMVHEGGHQGAIHIVASIKGPWQLAFYTGWAFKPHDELLYCQA